jgi:hypothetical protein
MKKATPLRPLRGKRLTNNGKSTFRMTSIRELFAYAAIAGGNRETSKRAMVESEHDDTW